MNKNCKNCLWTICNWFDKFLCVMQNRSCWQSKNPLPIGEFNPFPGTNANVPIPEVKPEKDSLKYYHVSYFFNLNNNEAGWGFGSTVCSCTLYFDPKEVAKQLDQQNNFKCIIINFVEIAKEIYDNNAG